jgi:hypothetical protein
MEAGRRAIRRGCAPKVTFPGGDGDRIASKASWCGATKDRPILRAENLSKRAIPMPAELSPQLSATEAVRVRKGVLSRAYCLAVIAAMDRSVTVAGSVLRRSRDVIDSRLRICSEHLGRSARSIACPNGLSEDRPIGRLSLAMWLADLRHHRALPRANSHRPARTGTTFPLEAILGAVVSANHFFLCF